MRRHPTIREPRRGLARALAGLVIALAVTALGATPAAAHAVMTSSTPGEGERLPTAPPSVTFTFNEDVDVGLGGVAVFDREGDRVDRGATEQPAPNRAQAALDPDLDEGTYLATYRVLSPDGHVVSDALVFAVGDELDEAAVAGLGDQTDPAADALGIASRALLYGGTLLALGLAFFARVLHDGASDARRYVPIVRIAGLVAVLGAVGKIVALAADATGRGLGAIADDGILGQVLRQGGVGWWLVGLLIGLAAIHVGIGLANRTAAQSVVFYGGLVAAGSFALTGHVTDADPRVAVGVADAVHVAVASVWFGGVVGLVLLLRWRAAASVSGVVDTAGVVIRFSNVAAVTVVLLWVSGAVQAWWTVGDLGALADTDYGRTLLIKLWLVVVALAAAGWNRWRLVPELLDAQDAVDATDTSDLPAEEEGEEAGDAGGEPPAPPRWGRLLRTVRIEAVALALAVVVTAGLVDTPPARIADAAAQPFNETLPVAEDLQVNLSVLPGSVGENELHVTYLDDTGMLTDRVEGLTANLSVPAVDIGPIEEEGDLIGDGHFIISTDSLAVAGTWEIELAVRLDGFDQEQTTFQVPIAG